MRILLSILFAGFILPLQAQMLSRTNLVFISLQQLTGSTYSPVVTLTPDINPITPDFVNLAGGPPIQVQLVNGTNTVPLYADGFTMTVPGWIYPLHFTVFPTNQTINVVQLLDNPTNIAVVPGVYTWGYLYQWALYPTNAFNPVLVNQTTISNLVGGGTLNFAGNGSGLTQIQGANVVGSVATNSIFSNNVAVLNSSVSQINTINSGSAFSWNWISTNIWDWWSADQILTNGGSAITNWVGRYGHGLGGQNPPTWAGSQVGGLPGLYFKGGEILTNTSIPPICSNSCTIFCVFRIPRPCVANAIVSSSANIIFDGSISAGSQNAWLAGNYSVSGGANASPPMFENAYPGESGYSYSDAANFNAGDDVRVYCVTWSLAGGYFYDFFDGKLEQNRTLSAPIGFAGTLGIGSEPQNTSQWPFQGYVSEMLIFTNALPLNQCDQISTFFMEKYHTARNTICLFGDSMIFGAYAGFGGTWPDFLSTNFPGYTIDDTGVNGATSAQVLSSVQATAPTGTCGAGHKIAVIWDNLQNGPETVGTITNNQILMAQTLQSNGWFTVLVMPPSNGFTDTNVSDSYGGIPLRQAYGNWASNCWPQNFNGFVNLAGDPNVGYSNAFINTQYYPPAGYINGVGVHWSSSGYQTTAPLLFSALNQTLTGQFPVSPICVPDGASFDVNQYVNVNQGNFFHNIAHWGGSDNNTFIGQFAGNLYYSAATANTIVGYDAGEFILIGGADTIIGQNACNQTTNGNSDVVIGRNAMFYNNIDQNSVIFGAYCEENTVNAFEETAIGQGAGYNQITGDNDIYLGYNAGINVLAGLFNIDIGNMGSALDQYITRIGTFQTNCIVAGTLIDTNGISSYATNTVPFGSQGLTNSTGKLLQVVEFYGNGVWWSNGATGFKLPLGSWSSYYQNLTIKANDCLIGNGMVIQTNMAL